MGLTITEKILAAHCRRDTVKPGEIVNASIDLIVAHDVTTPPAIVQLEKMGVDKVFDASRIVVTPDHFVPNKDIKSAELSKTLRNWAAKQGIEHYYELGNHGICHAIVPEKGHVLPGTTVINADSHTCTLGAFGAFATGIGSTDLAAALATGELWFRVPETMLFEVKGRLGEGVYSKDLVLYVISKIGCDGANYRAMEYRGECVSLLSMESRMTVCNMGIEAGAKNAIMAADEVTLEYVRERTDAPFQCYESDADAEYCSVMEIDASALEPVVAVPFLPSNGRFVGEVEGTVLDQVYIGSCTNARIEDLRVAASIVKGNHVARGLRAIVVPATTDIWRGAMKEGLLETFA
ncbi:MAG: 3-isopropylmalate dehydratase large subunit, partial [Blastocatellia bacterium]